MRRRKYDFATITEFPELATELPALLFDLGTVSQMRYELTDSFVSLTIRLNRPARVWHIPGTRPEGTVSIDPHTRRCVGTRLPIRVDELPLKGDVAVRLVIQLELDSREVPIVEHTAEHVRQLIREFAAKAQRGWYYPLNVTRWQTE